MLILFTGFAHKKVTKIKYYSEKFYGEFLHLTLCGTRKLQFFHADILEEFKNRLMPKTVNAI